MVLDHIKFDYILSFAKTSVQYVLHCLSVVTAALTLLDLILVLISRDTYCIVDPNASNNRKLDCKEIFWWNGLQIVGPRPKLGLLGSFFDSTLGKQESPPINESLEASPEEESSCSSSNSSSSDGSEESNPRPAQKVKKMSKLCRDHNGEISY